ncbi:MAG: NAD-dependent epimerase/dehydratase family protein [Chlamydiales bacterium]
MNILITGGTGFLGSAITKNLLADGHKVFVTGREPNVPNGAILCNTHLTGLNWTALSKENIEVLFHYAANNDTQSQDEADMIRANFDAPCYLFNMLYRFGCRKFVYASSAAVYGNSPAPYVEDETPLEPLTIYGKSKVMFDKFAMDFAKERRDVSVIGLRYSNVYGEGEQHKGRRASMIYQMIDKLYTGENIQLFEFGDQERDWIYIDDVVKANKLTLKHRISGIYNCGTGVATSFNRLLEIINQVYRLFPRKPIYIQNPIAETYQNHTCCNIDKIKKDLNFTANYSIESGIEKMTKFFEIFCLSQQDE